MLFPTFFNLNLNMAIRSSRSEPQSFCFCFCWLYRASPSLAANNIINLISVLIIWWGPCVESSLVLLEEGIYYDSVFSWKNTASLCPASFRTPRLNLPVIPIIFWLHTFIFQSPMMKRVSVFGVSSRRSCRSS